MVRSQGMSSGNRIRQMLEVAGWEFMRFFKWKSELSGVLLTAVIGFALIAGQRLINRSAAGKPVRIAVVNPELLPFFLSHTERFQLLPDRGESEKELRTAVGNRAIDGLLILRSREEAELLVHKEPLWKTDLLQLISAELLRVRLQEANLSAHEFALLTAPFDLQVVYHPHSRQPTSLVEKISAGSLVFLMLMGVFMGFTYQFISITGEKQLRITELILSAISPQTWIDGKILGITALGLKSMILYGGVMLISALTFDRFLGVNLSIPLALTNPALLLLFIIIVMLGLLFWNCFFAAIAATIDDPNSSTRTSMMLLPFLPVFFAFYVLKNPDSLVMKFFTIFPVTSPAVLPARLVLTRVAFWEIAAAFVLMIGCIWILRRMAGKIFRLGMLMYGKEPGWKEMAHWLKQV
ncbi:MAG: ABC transporter permease [bacterium]